MDNTSVPTTTVSGADLDYIASEIINSVETESELVTLLEFFLLAYPDKFIESYEGICDFEHNNESSIYYNGFKGRKNKSFR